MSDLSEGASRLTRRVDVKYIEKNHMGGEDEGLLKERPKERWMTEGEERADTMQLPLHISLYLRPCLKL